MGLFNNFPYMDLSNLNLDFVLKKLKDLTNYTQSAEQAAESAEQSASSAQQSAESAELSASNAQQSAESAEASAGSAQDYAENIADPVGGLVTGWLDENITPTTPPVDASLTIQGAAADAKAVGDAINALAVQVANGMPYAVKIALDNIIQNVAFKNDGNYTADKTEIHNWATGVSIVSLTAVFNSGGNTTYTDDSLDSLRQYLTVTAAYDNGTSAVVTTYTLSGTLEAGQNTITVSYGGASTTFSVTAVAPLYSLPNVAETTVTNQNNTATIKIENGLVTYNGNVHVGIYVDKNGNVSTTQPTNNPWFSAEQGSELINSAQNITWNTSSGSNQALQFKWANNEASGNLATAELSVASNSSGSDGETSFTVDLTQPRVYSAFCFQWQNLPTAGGSCTFRIRLFVDGVRYF